MKFAHAFSFFEVRVLNFKFNSFPLLKLASLRVSVYKYEPFFTYLTRKKSVHCLVEKCSLFGGIFANITICSIGNFIAFVICFI